MPPGLCSQWLARAGAGTAWHPPAHAQSADEKIIVSGASGNLGGLTVEALLARGVPASRLILVSRTPEELKQYADRGASVRYGDFTKPESLPTAYAGGSRMLLISVGGSGEVTAAALLMRAIDAAKAAGVDHIAYTSYVGLTRGDVGPVAPPIIRRLRTR